MAPLTSRQRRMRRGRRSPWAHGQVRLPLIVVVALGAAGVGCASASTAVADRIVFERPSSERPGTNPAYRIWTVQSNGKGLHQLKTSSQATGIDLSRDGRKLAWVRFPGSATELVAGDPEAAHVSVILKRRGQQVGRVRWSPSGRALAFSEGDYPNRRVGVLNLRSRRVTTFKGLTLGDWSPDGRTIVGGATAKEQPALCSPLGTCLPYAPGLYALDTQTGTIRTILAFSTGDEPLASWSPDGRLIAFSRTEADLRNDPNPVYQIWVVKPDGSGLRQVTTRARGASSPTWSPDGRRLAFVGTQAGGRQYLGTIRLDGTGSKRLTRDLFGIVGPDWER
jgi:Tol biopolymer transport system component